MAPFNGFCCANIRVVEDKAFLSVTGERSEFDAGNDGGCNHDCCGLPKI